MKFAGAAARTSRALWIHPSMVSQDRSAGRARSMPDRVVRVLADGPDPAVESYPAHMTDSPLSPQEIRVAAEVHRELGPEYSDAVVASFLEKVDREITARVEARLAEMLPTAPAKTDSRRTLLTGIAIGAAVGGIPLLLLLVIQARNMSQVAVRHVSPAAGGNVTQVVSRSSASSGWLLLALIVVAICAVAAVWGRSKQRPAGLL
jgi:hypothetical protein